MTVTACFVARDHGPVLPDALRAVAGFASERIVVDTGSSDNTAEVAVAGGAKLVRINWADDFSAACNAALAAATGEWILWLNPDERLEPQSGPLLTEAMRDDRVFAYGITVRHQLAADQPDRVSEDIQPRLFRNTPAMRYAGRLHPDFDPPLQQLATAAGQVLALAPPAASLRRLAYLSPVTPDKVRWTNRLIEAELRDHPGRIDLQIELGRNLLRLSDARGHEVLAAAANALPDGDRPPVPNAGELLEYALTADPAAVSGRLDRAAAARLADKWYPATPPVVWALASDRYAAGDFAAAAHHLKRLLEMGRTGLYDHSLAFDPDIVGPAAALNLAVALTKIGQPDEARAVLTPLAGNPTYRERAGLLYRSIG